MTRRGDEHYSGRESYFGSISDVWSNKGPLAAVGYSATEALSTLKDLFYTIALTATPQEQLAPRDRFDVLEEIGKVNSRASARRRRASRVTKEDSELVKKTSAVASIFAFAGGIFLLSPNLTGNVIGNLTNQSSNLIGAGLIVVGMALAFLGFGKN